MVVREDDEHERERVSVEEEVVEVDCGEQGEEQGLVVALGGEELVEVEVGDVRVEEAD